MAEIKHSIIDCTDPDIIAFSVALANSRLPEGFDAYYEAGGSPYFKIPKSYLKENEDDPDTHYLFVDIDKTENGVEYSLYVTFTSEHFSSAEECIRVMEKIYFGEAVEVSLITPTFLIGCIIDHTGNHEKNVDKLAESIGPLFELAKERADVLSSGHFHVHFDLSITGNALIQNSKDHIVNGITVCFVSSTFAVHPEYYVVQ